MALVGCVHTEPLPEEFSALNDQVAELFQSQRSAPAIRYVKRPRLAEDAYAATFADRIDIAQDALPTLRFFLAHELAHWHIWGTAWESLPQVFQETVADYAACSLTGVMEDRRAEVRRAGDVAVALDVLSIDREGWRRLAPEEQEPYVRLAFEAVDRIGLEELERMCERGETSVSEILERAGLEPASVD